MKGLYLPREKLFPTYKENCIGINFYRNSELSCGDDIYGLEIKENQLFSLILN